MLSKPNVSWMKSCWAAGCASLLVTLLHCSVANGQSSVEGVKTAWLKSLPSFDDGSFHYRANIKTIFDDPEVAESGRFTDCPDMDLETGRLNSKVLQRYEKRFPDSGEVDAFVASRYLMFDGDVLVDIDTRDHEAIGQNYTIHSAKFGAEKLREWSLPFVDPLFDVLGWPLDMAAPETSVPGSSSALYGLESALPGSYSVVNESKTTVTISNGNQDSIRLSKLHGHQIESRTWKSDTERVEIENKGWQKMGEAWFPKSSQVKYDGLDGERRFLVSYEFELLEKLALEDYQLDMAQIGDRIRLATPDGGNTIVNVKEPVSLHEAGTHEVDLEQFLVGNRSRSFSLPVRVVIVLNLLLIAAAAFYHFVFRGKSETNEK